MANLKKGFNNWKGETHVLQKEIDAFRREILMYEKLNAMLVKERTERDGEYQQILSETQAIN